MHLTKEDVFRAADSLAERGEEPTQHAVREACGNRGSETTINKHLRAWRVARDAARARIASELSDADKESALAVFASMHADMRTKYEAKLTRTIEDHSRREAELSAELEKAAEETDRLLLERDAALARIKAEEISVQNFKNDLFGATVRIRILEHEKDVLESRLAEAEKFTSHLAKLAEKIDLLDAAKDPETTPEPEQPAA